MIVGVLFVSWLVLQSALPDLYSQLQLDNKGSWSGFTHSAECENNLPVQLAHKLTPFQKVLVVQALRPDRLHSTLIKFALQTLGTVKFYSQEVIIVQGHLSSIFVI